MLACGDPSATLRFSGIPDGDKRALKVGYETVADYLGKHMGRPVRYVHVPDYTAAVTALATHKVDFAWLGGVTAVQAEARTPGGVHFVAARQRDLEFRSYVIANRDVATSLQLRPLDARRPQALDELAALTSHLRGRTFAFGAKSSTSGHIMPRSFLQKVDFDPDTELEGGPRYQLKGGHAATLRGVASGAVDFGVLNFAVWEAATPELQAAAPVVYVTPEYVDYCLVAHGRLARADVDKLRHALTTLDASTPGHAEVLAAFSAERFVEADAGAWDGIRGVLHAVVPGDA